MGVMVILHDNLDHTLGVDQLSTSHLILFEIPTNETLIITLHGYKG